MASDEPAYLGVGTEVSAKYRGAFCEARVKKLIKYVKCKVILKNGGRLQMTDEDVVGPIKVGTDVQVKLPDSGELAEATLSRVTDCSTYTVVFNDGDENTLRRTQLCLKGEKHFVHTETLDELPLTHPEHFGTPVMKVSKGYKRGQVSTGLGTDSESSDGEPSESGGKSGYKGGLKDLVGTVVCVDLEDRKKSMWGPALVVLPNPALLPATAKPYVLLKSFKDGKMLTVTHKEMTPFTADMSEKKKKKKQKAASATLR